MNSRLEAAGQWLMRLREDTLSDAEMSEWIAWCEADPGNLQAFEELQALWRAAGEGQPLPAQQDRAGFIRRSWPVAAALSILAVGAVIFFGRSGPTQLKVAASDLVQTSVAADRQALLPDGSQVDLGARSALEVNFTSARRQLKLRDGQAFFQVKPDAARPFVVDAGGIEVLALGTAFDVRRTPEQVTITVQEGLVEVRGAGAEPARLAAGDQLTFDVRTTSTRKSPVDPAVALAWRAGRLEFVGDPLAVVLASVNRYSHRPVVLADAKLGELAFTGTVFVDSIDASLDAMEQVFPITVDRRGEREIVLSRRP